MHGGRAFHLVYSVRVRRTLRVVSVLILLAGATVAHADIAEQRRRLPPAPEYGCSDPIAGDWQSQFWTNGYWLARTLRLERVTPAGSTSVSGTELIEVWSGPREIASRPTCDPRAPIGWYTGTSPLLGTFDGTRLDVRATRFDAGSVRCGNLGGYVPDHFRGKLESGGTELHTRNDDGTNPETTVVFRRVTCADGGPAPAPSPPPAAPAPLPPPREAAGCASYLPGL